MKHHSLLIILIGFCLISNLFADLVNPGVELFYANLMVDIDNELTFTDNNNHIYDSRENIDASCSTKALIINIESSADITIEYLDLSGYKSIIFNINGPSDINIENCTFELKDGIEFNFSDSSVLYPANDPGASITIDNCNFNFNFLTDTISHTQLLFTKDTSYSGGDGCALRNVQIANSTFNYNPPLPDNSNTRIYTCISFYRDTENVSFSDISITDNTITFSNSNNLSTQGICFYNKNGGLTNNNDFVNSPTSDSLYYYHINKNINISHNTLTTNSGHPHFGVFIQGPYDYITFEDNTIDGFGRVDTDNNSFSHAVAFYGCRKQNDPPLPQIATHVNDINNILIRNNNIKTRSSGIKINGSNVLIEQNYIEILKKASYWESIYVSKSRIAINAFKEYKTKINTGLTIRNNIINCNEMIASTGIYTNTNSFNISDNTIIKPNNFGILYGAFCDGDIVNNFNIGTSCINNNIINYGDQTYNYLNDTLSLGTYWGIPPARGIFFYRDSLNNIQYPNDNLEITNNVVYKDGSIDNIHLWDKTNSNFSQIIQNNNEGVLPLDSTEPQGNTTSIYDELEASGDVNGDGFADVIYIKRINSSTLRVITKINNGDGTWDEVTDNESYSTLCDDYPINTGDFNGDGRMDIAFTVRTASCVYASILEYDITNECWTKHIMPYFSDNRTQMFDGSIVIGDASGDGNDDIVIIFNDNGYMKALTISKLSNDTWERHEESIGTLDATIYPAMGGDFNGDGDIDLAFAHLNNSNELRITIYTSDGDNTWTQLIRDFSSYDSIVYGDRHVIGDITGDSKDDIVFIFRSSGELKILSIWPDSTNVGSCLQTHTDGTGVDENPVLSGDFNGDGLMDFGFYGLGWQSVSEMTVRLRTSKGDGTWGALYQIFTDITTDNYPVFANNFDQDERTDLLFSTHPLLFLKYYLKHTVDFPAIGFSKKVLTQIEENIPFSYKLCQNYPNPFNPITTIEYELKEKTDVKLVIYDICGRKINELLNTKQTPGKYQIMWNGTNRRGVPVASGIYIYSLITDQFKDTKKMTLLK